MLLADMGDDVIRTFHKLLNPFVGGWLFAITACLFLAASETNLADDTYIFFRYARNFCDYGQLTWNPGVEWCNGFTSTTYVLYLSAFYGLGFPLISSTMISGFLAYAVGLIFVAGIGRRLRLP